MASIHEISTGIDGKVTIEYSDGTVESGHPVLFDQNTQTIVGSVAQQALISTVGSLSGTVTSVAGKTGAVTLTPSDIGGIKTINGQSLVGSGDIVVSGGSGAVSSVAGKTGAVTLTVSDISGLGSAATQSALSFAPATNIQSTALSSSVQTSLSKADSALQSSSIKTVNGQSLIGSGDITVSGGSGPTLPSLVSYTTTIPLDGNKYMVRTAISGAVQYQIAAGAVAGGQCKVAVIANGVNVPTYNSNINVDPAGDPYNNTSQRLHNLFFWNDGEVNWVTIMDTGLAVQIPATSLLVSGPSSGVNNTTSTPFTVSANGSLASSVVVTPSSTIAGTFSPVSATLNSGSTVQFTFTPSTTGNATVTFAASGLTSASGPYSVTAAATAPLQVTGVTLGSATTSTQVVTFSAPGNGGSAITDYVLQYATSGSGSWVTFPDGVSTSAGITVTGLTPSTSYDYRVAAVNSVGTGPYSAVVTGSTSAVTAPGAPTIGTATAGDGNASVTFTAPASDGGSAITGYTVTASTGQTANGTSSPITVSGLTNGTPVTFTVRATNSAGTGPASASSNSVTPQSSTPSYVISGFDGNAVRSTSNASALSTFGTLKPITNSSNADGQFTQSAYWTITPSVTNARSGWGTSPTVAPAEITSGANAAGSASVNGLTPMAKPGAFFSESILWVTNGSGNSTWYFWIKPEGAPAQMVGTLNVTGA